MTKKMEKNKFRKSNEFLIPNIPKSKFITKSEILEKRIEKLENSIFSLNLSFENIIKLIKNKNLFEQYQEKQFNLNFKNKS
mgnify:CR=1 FL=1|tara:strand:- start:295 stop:537 length:243 start_codon:yes stop_codon:yes gene_type:complete